MKIQTRVDLPVLNLEGRHILINNDMESIVCVNHDDVIKWKNFLRYGILCGNSPVTGEFPAQMSVIRSFDVE